MPDMKVSITVDGWSNLSNREQSFINFFMKDAVLQFHGVYNDSTFDHLVARIKSKFATFLLTTNTITDAVTSASLGNFSDGDKLLYVEIPYCNEPNQGVSNFPASLDKLSPDEYDLTTIEDITMNLSQTRVSKLVLSGCEPSDNTTATANKILNNNITLNPLIENTTNSDSSLKPVISLANPNFEVGIVLQDGQTLDVQYDYVTSSLKIGDREVYYKFGYIPLSEQPTNNYISSSTFNNDTNIESWLQSSLLLFSCWDGYESEYGAFSFKLIKLVSEDNYEDLDSNCISQEGSSYLTNSWPGPRADTLRLPVRMIMPAMICNVDSEGTDLVPKYLLYLQLFDSNTDTQISEDIVISGSTQVFCKNSEGDWVEMSVSQFNDNYYTSALRISKLS
jgi:hypothetical protein